MPDYPSTMFTAEWFVKFWGVVKWFMSYYMPIFMICMAVLVVSLVLDLIGDTMQTAKDEYDKSKDDDDYEIRRY